MKVERTPLDVQTALKVLQDDPSKFPGDLRLSAAVRLYSLGRLTQGEAARVAGLPRAEFLDALWEFGVSPFQVETGELSKGIDECLKPGSGS